MKRYFLISLLVLLIVAAAACAAPPVYPAPITPPPTWESTVSPGSTPSIEYTPPPSAGTIAAPPVPSFSTPTPSGGNMIPAVERVIQSYASQKNLAVTEIKLVSAELVDWPDGCLGVVIPGMACIEVITPGYRILLDVNGASVELHSTLSGDYYVEAAPGSGGGFPLK